MGNNFTNTFTVDLNCDMGEGIGNDAAIMPFISSANIACGYHAGDADTMKHTIELAQKNNISIGAHTGFRDKENFGRTEQNLSTEALYELISEQLYIFNKHSDELGASITHVKPHGALYNMAAVNKEMSAIIAKAIKDFDESLFVYGKSGSFLISEAKIIGLKTASEVFADRTYQDDGSLTSRKESGALIESVDISIEQVLQMVLHKKVKTITGKEIFMEAETICIHGDGKNAVSFARSINQSLKEKGILIQSIKNL